MKLIKTLALLAALALSPAAPAAGFLEKEVVFSEAQIQAALEKAKPMQMSYGEMAAVALKEPPRISLDGSDGRARIAAGLDVELQGNPPLRVDLTGRAGVRYDDRGKAFYLENPVIDSVASPTLAKEATPAVRQLATQMIRAYFRTKPVYVLREHGSAQEQAARWLLKSVRIESGRVVAVLSPI